MSHGITRTADTKGRTGVRSTQKILSDLINDQFSFLTEEDVNFHHNCSNNSAPSRTVDKTTNQDLPYASYISLSDMQLMQSTIMDGDKTDMSKLADIHDQGKNTEAALNHLGRDLKAAQERQASSALFEVDGRESSSENCNAHLNSDVMLEDLDNKSKSETSYSNKETTSDYTELLEKCETDDFEGVSVIRRDKDTMKCSRKLAQLQRSCLVEDDENSDDESSDGDDDDNGVYDSSFRSSKWIFNRDEDENNSESKADEPIVETNVSESEHSSSSSSNELLQSENEEANDSLSGNTSNESESEIHELQRSERSDSVSTTLSEHEFRRTYREVSVRKIQRKSSAQRFIKQNTASISIDKLVRLERGSQSGGLGFHIKGDHPTIITTVIGGGYAESRGLEVGDIIVAVNGQGVLHMTKDEIVELLKRNKDITLELCKPSSLRHMNGSQELEEHYVVHTGYLSKLANSILNLWTKRWFVLKSDNCLYYYKTESSRDILGAIPISGYLVQRATDLKWPKKHAIKLMHSVRTYYLAADSESGAANWAKVLNEASERQSDMTSWLDASAHNVGIPALSIQKPDCHGYLYKTGGRNKAWKRRYAVLKDGCLYYYLNMNSPNAKGVAHLHGYLVLQEQNSSKKNAFSLEPPEPNMRKFEFYVDSEAEKERWMNSMIKSIARWVKIPE